MGHLFLDAYHATGDDYYYRAAEQVASALMFAQHPSGGWNYIADFAGEASLRKWYDTIGKNAWRLEEFQHYYGNATFDDAGTAESAKFFLRLYVEKKDPKYKAPLDKAIKFVLDSQYPIGVWPQRFPKAPPAGLHGLPDYTSYATFNDDVAAENMDFLLMCYQAFGDAALDRSDRPRHERVHRHAARSAAAGVGTAAHARSSAVRRAHLRAQGARHPHDRRQHRRC